MRLLTVTYVIGGSQRIPFKIARTDRKTIKDVRELREHKRYYLRISTRIKIQTFLGYQQKFLKSKEHTPSRETHIINKTSHTE